MKKSFLNAILCLTRAGHIPPRKRLPPPKKIILLFTIVGLLLSVATFAQNPATKTYQVTGIVTDSALVPLPGVSVTVKNSKTIGTVTDQNGKFILDVPDKAVLVFTTLNYALKEITVTSPKYIYCIPR